MQILFNDQAMQCAAGQTVHELLEQLDQRQAGAALAINQQIVPREQWAQHIVQDGDQLLLRPGEETIWYYAHEQDKVKRLCNDMTELLEKKLARYLNEQ